MRPLNNKVIVKILEDRQETASGLILKGAVSNIVTCLVSSLPLGEEEILVGDKVLVPRDRMAEIGSHYIVDRKDVLAILE